MDMDNFLSSGESRESSKTVKASELVTKLKVQTNEETRERLDSFLSQVSSIIDFAHQRIEEVSTEYEEIASLGDFGCVMSATMEGKPLVYAAAGSLRAINSTTQFAMLKAMALQFKGSRSSKEEEENEENEENEEE